MSTLLGLRTALRVLLDDADSSGYLWSDAQLNRYLADAVKGYSRRFPREMEASITTVAGQREYDLPPDCDRVAGVELVEDLLVLVEGGDSYGDGYYVYGGKLGLMPEPATGGKTLDVRYLAPHASLSLDADVSTVPAGDEEMLLALAAAKAMRSVATDAAKRGQFEEHTGQSALAASAAYQVEWESGARSRGRRVRPGRLVAR